MADVKILNVKEAQGKNIRLSDYTHIRAYHACRAEDEQIFRTQGLKPYTTDEALAVAIHKLKSECVSNQAIETKFYTLWKENAHTQVWLMLETTEFFDTSTHYLIYGSEFINALAMHLGCRDILKENGNPMIVACNVPISDISSCWLNDLEQDIRDRSTEHRAIAVNVIAPENVFDISYPAGSVRDPYSGGHYKLG